MKITKQPEAESSEERDFPGIGDLPLEELQPKIDEWKLKHKNVHQISVDLEEGVTFNGVFRVPTEADIKSATREGLTAIDSSKELARLTVLYPEPMDFHKILVQYWGLAVPISEQLTQLAQLTKKATVKKL